MAASRFTQLTDEAKSRIHEITLEELQAKRGGVSNRASSTCVKPMNGLKATCRAPSI